MADHSIPEEIRVARDKRSLTLLFPGASAVSLPAEMLRVMSPSAEVQGHSPDQKTTVAGKIGVAIANVVPVGHYAVRVVFDDGHDTGIFTWPYLSTLAREREARWAAYLGELAAKGLSRER